MEADAIIHLALQAGANHAASLPVAEIPFDTVFRAACEANSCGNYGKSWMCPPDVGHIDALIQQAKSHTMAVVYQSIHPLEDSYDFEGMMEAGEKHNEIAQNINRHIHSTNAENYIHLGAGGCRFCPTCSKVENLPCRYPEKAMSSLEAYGISVSELASKCGMKYINGTNTVTYFGALIY